MSNNFSRNTQKIKTIYDQFNEETLVVDESYQRRKVWGVKDNIRLIETILLDLVIPEIFFWDYKTDPNTGKTITHIVDGQQRINAIFAFISDQFKLTEKHLLDENIIKEFADKKFTDLPDETKTDIWKYEISIVDLKSDFSKDAIRNMFYRLNLTDYSLNEQEKRNSWDSEFGKVAEELSNNDFWDKFKVFSSADIRRMKDVEYCSSILILCREGIVDQTKPDKLNQIYKDFADEYNDAEKDKQKIYKAMGLINELVDDNTKSFSNKKIQMYTLFCLAFDFIDNKIPIGDEVKLYFQEFVNAYNLFKNEFDFDFDNAEHRHANELIKKYKLASSEGVNKLNNRMIRFEVMKKILLQQENLSIDDLKHIAEQCKEAVESNE